MFDPAPDLTDQLLCALADGDQTLAGLAASHDISLGDLITWLALPATQARLAVFETALLARTRLAAANALSRALLVATALIDAYDAEERHHPVRLNSIQDREQRRRSRETARRAASLLLRLARVRPARHLPAAQDSPPAPIRRAPAHHPHVPAARPSPLAADHADSAVASSSRRLR